MVLSNASSRARNMTQTGNQPQAADFGDIFPSVGFGAYGSRNRRQRGVGNITLWSTTKQRANHGRNTGRNVTASRSGSWNVKGTSANVILINEVNDAQGVLTAATTADANAITALTAATNALYDSNTGILLGQTAIADLNNAIGTLTTELRNLSLTDQTASNTRDGIVTNLENITILTSTDYDPLDTNAPLTPADIKAVNTAFLAEVSARDALYNTYTTSTGTTFTSTTDAATIAVTRGETYDAAVITKANTDAAKTAATTALVAAQAAVY